MSESEVGKCLECSGQIVMGCLNDAPCWRRGKSLLVTGACPSVFAFRCKSCNCVEFYAEDEWERRR